MAYRDLSVKERHAIIRAGVANGMRSLADIEKAYNASLEDSNEFSEGGSIHIAPSKKGTFTAAATKHGKSVQAFASQVLAHKENYSPAMVKKANFARNAAHWHFDGGSNWLPDFAYNPTSTTEEIRARLLSQQLPTTATAQISSTTKEDIERRKKETERLEFAQKIRPTLEQAVNTMAIGSNFNTSTMNNEALLDLGSRLSNQWNTVLMASEPYGAISGIIGERAGEKINERLGNPVNPMVAGLIGGTVSGGLGLRYGRPFVENASRVVKGTYDTFGKGTDIWNRVTHPITTIRVGGLQSKIKPLLPKPIYDEFLNTLKTTRYNSKGELSYSPKDNSLNGLLSLNNDNFGLAHELGHIVTRPFYGNKFFATNRGNYFYNIGAPSNYKYTTNTLTDLPTIQNEFYSDLISSSITGKPLIQGMPGSPSVFADRYKVAKQFVGRPLFTTNQRRWKTAQYPNLPMNFDSRKWQRALQATEHNLNQAVKSNDDIVFESLLGGYDDAILRYGFNKKEAIQWLKDRSEIWKRITEQNSPMKIFLSTGGPLFSKQPLPAVRYANGGKKIVPSKTQIVQAAWANENPTNRGLQKNGLWVQYDDPKGNGLKNVGPGLLVGATIPNKKEYTKQELDNAAYTFGLEGLASIGDAYNEKYGTKAFPTPFDTVSVAPKLLMLDTRYQNGRLPIGSWPALYQAIADSNWAEAIKQSRSTYVTDDGVKHYDNDRVRRRAESIFPGMFDVSFIADSPIYPVVKKK